MENTINTPTLEATLLQWLRSFENVSDHTDWQSVTDGKPLWAILQELDPDYFTAPLPEPDIGAQGDWLRKWQNLKHVERQIAFYYRDVCSGQEGLAPACVPDLKAIASDGSVEDLQKLIMTIIRAAMASPECNHSMAQRLISMGKEKAVLIADKLRSMEEPDFSDSEPPSRDEASGQPEPGLTPTRVTQNGGRTGESLYDDSLLEREEQLLQAQATIERLQVNYAAAQRQMEELRLDKERLQAAFDSFRADIESRGRKTVDDDEVRKLQRQADSDQSYIEELESQLQNSRSTMESYERQIERLKGEQDASQRLRDDLQSMRAENEELNQKVRANENLKKKIQGLQEQEKANATLREDLRKANERLGELERMKQIQARLEKEIIEKQGLIRNQEYQITELTTTRKHAEYDARVLAQKLEAARERHDRDHEALQELRAKFQETKDDDSRIDAAPLEEKQPSNSIAMANTQAGVAENKHLAEKLALLEQQLQAADARLKQASQRNAALQEAAERYENEVGTRQKAEADLKQREKMIADLQHQVEQINQLHQVQQADTPDTAEMAALRSENKLIATAWYDLAHRLQQPGVTLGRRRYEPKSWIGKQRALVGPHNNLLKRQ